MTKNEWHDWADESGVFNVPAIKGFKGQLVHVILANGLWFVWEREWEKAINPKQVSVQSSPPESK